VSRWLIVAALVSVAGCRQILGLDDLPTTGPGVDGSNEAASTIDAPDAAPGACGLGDPSLRACFRFENNTEDDSEFHNNAISNGATFETGVDGLAVVTTASSITIPSSASLTLSQMTLKLAIRPRSISATTRSGLIDNDAYRLFLEPGGTIRCAVNGGTEQVTTSMTVPANAWTRIACTYDGATLRVYLDGVPAAAAAFTDTIIPPGEISIGQNSPVGENFDGAIDNLEIHDSVVEPP
jgi:hypothetical protein